MKELTNKARTYIDDHQYQARQAERNARSVIVALERAEALYHKTGVFFLDYESYELTQRILQVNLLTDFKKRAQKDKRPFVMGAHGAYHDWRIGFTSSYDGVSALYIQKKQRLGYVVAPLLAAAVEVSRSKARYSEHVLTLLQEAEDYKGPQAWKFHFRGREGEELLTEFITSFEKNPGARAAMNL